MADATTIVEGNIKFREGKKWKPRWCVLKKPSPVADQLQVVLFKDVKEVVKPDGKPKSVFALDLFFGLEAGFAFEREQHVMAIVCQRNICLMAFELREHMIQFEIGIRQSLGEEHQFKVRVAKAPSNSRLPKEQICLMIHDLRFCLITQTPPKILLSWNIEDLRRFGATEGKFCFEGGSRCGKGTGVFALLSDQAEDIADIVKLAATGKMSNCHRKFKNRNSQIDLGNHLIADMSSSPSSSSIHHTHHHNTAARPFPQGGLPTTLNCCHESQTGSAESEDWSWYKRHSVSVMDHRRIAALREKGFPENREQLAMGIYDVPPNHGRKLGDDIQEVLEEPNYAQPKSDPENVPPMSSSNTSSRSTPVTSSTPLSGSDYGNYKKIEPRQKDPENSTLEQRQAMLRKRQSASAEFFDHKVSSMEEMITGVGQHDLSNGNEHEESLQRLKKQESDLQREMVLLDEILQDCMAHSQDLSCSSYSQKSVDAEKNGCVPASERSPDGKILGSGFDKGTEHSSNKSLFTTLDEDLTIISGNISPLRGAKCDLAHSTPPKKVDRTAVLRLNTSMPEGTPISPLFHAKLRSIPPTSRFNAPLPYVNLSKYDDESNSHVYLPGSADCVPVARGSSMQSLNGGSHKHLGLGGHSHSLTSLHTSATTPNFTIMPHPARPHASNRIHIYDERLAERIQHLGPSLDSGANHRDNDRVSGQHQEILVVKMDSQPGAHSTPLRSTARSPARNSSRNNAKADIVQLLTTDAGRPLREEKRTKTEEIYENLPVKRDITPPPALPPKGPALLKRLKASASKVSSQQAVSQSARPIGQCSQEVTLDKKIYGYDNHPKQVAVEREQARKTEMKEDNYLIMGSPKVRHKLPTVTESVTRTHVSLDIVTSPTGGQYGNSAAVRRSDYMDMATVGTEGLDCANDDEIYLDVDADEAFHPRDLYISEADLKLPTSTSTSAALGESTYMEMSSVSNKKTVIMQNLETLQTYVNKTPAGENPQAKSPLTSQAKGPAPSPPPRPMSLKVRHNSDSGIFPTKAADSTSSEGSKEEKSKPKPVKSPTKVYTKVKKTNEQNQTSEPPTPFPNLIEFTKKMSDSRSTYVNTYVDADKNLVPQETYVSRDVPLPEPVREGFLARFKRRSSKDKNATPVQEKSSNSKNRNSVLERSMSEHESTKEAKDEKSSRLKLGRRRSSSFPNRLSYQESLDSTSMTQTASSSSSFSSGSSRPKPALRHTDQSESSSSIQDFSDDSDMSPLLKRGDRRADPRALTILHVHRYDQLSVNPYLQTSKSLVKANALTVESSKTDDEKLIEMIQQKGQSKRTVIYQRSSSLELKKQNQVSEQSCFLKLPQTPHRKERRFSFEKLIGCSSSFNSNIPCSKDAAKSPDSTNYSYSDLSRNSSMSSSSVSLENAEDVPPPLPPKTRPYQGPLSPVIEAIPPIPSISEPVYVELDEVFSTSDAERDGKEKEKIQAELCTQPLEENEEGNAWHTERDIESKAGRPSHAASEENLSGATYTTLSIPIDLTLADGNESEGERSSRTSPFTSLMCHSTTDLTVRSECTSPAKSVLRPRSGQEYVVIRRSSIPTSRSSASLPSHSPLSVRMFNFDLHHPSEILHHHHHHYRPHQHHHHHHHRHHLSCSRSPGNTPQPSPSISSAAETSKSYISLSNDPWEHDLHRSRHGHDGKSPTKSVTATPSPASSPHPLLSHRCGTPVAVTSGHKLTTPHEQLDDSIFFPMDMSFNASPPSSPIHHNAQSSSNIHHPIYVNQEFVDKYHNAMSSNQTVSTPSSHSSTSPLKAGMQSFMSLIFRDFSVRHGSSSDSHAGTNSQRKNRTRSRHSESDAHKIDRHSLSLPAAKPCQSLTLPLNIPYSHSDPKRLEKEDKPLPALAQEHSMAAVCSKVHQKEYDKFAKSSIISRRRQQCSMLNSDQNTEAVTHGSETRNPSTENTEESGLYLQIPGVKSSGYKNIDCINAVNAAITTPSPKNLSSGPDASHAGHTSQLENISESQMSPREFTSSLDRGPDAGETFVFGTKPSADSQSVDDSTFLATSIALPHVSSPPPPLPLRNRLSSSPPSSPSLTPIMTPSDISDSPPPYFAPSPPSSPQPPTLPPRVSLLPQHSPVPPSTPSEVDNTSDSFEEEQELNYIEIDMTNKSSSEAPPPPPVSFSSRRSRRNRQQKNKDYAKLRYAVIDHRATRALQQTRQELVEGRDGSLRRGTSKESRSGTHLSRINSAPASSKRKPLSLKPRERKLSSGSVESC